MDDMTTCPRCRAGILVTALAEWSVTTGPERLRSQGWVGFVAPGGTRTAVHLGCLTWAEKEVLLSGAREPEPRAHPRPARRFVRDAQPQRALEPVYAP